MSLRLCAHLSVALVILVSVFVQGAAPSVLAGSQRMPVHLTLIHPGVLTVGSDTTYPPMEASDINHPGTFIGADVDLANALARAMHLSGARIVSTSFTSLISALARHNFDVIMSSMNDTPGRRKKVSFIDYMQLRAAEAIVVPKSSSLHANGYHGLCGHSVSVEKGTAELLDLTAADQSCKNKINIKTFTADTDAFQALASGHSDAYTTDLPVALFYVKAHGGSIRFAGKAFGSGAFYGVGLARGNTALHRALAGALAKIRANGQYRRILAKWGLSSTHL